MELEHPGPVSPLGEEAEIARLSGALTALSMKGRFGETVDEHHSLNAQTSAALWIPHVSTAINICFSLWDSTKHSTSSSLGTLTQKSLGLRAHTNNSSRCCINAHDF